MIAILGKQNVDYITGKRDHFVVLATVQSDMHCKIKKTTMTRDLKPVLNENVGCEKILLYWPLIFFPADLTKSVYYHLLFHCHYYSYFVLVFACLNLIVV